MPDAATIARQEELRSRHRDLTKPVNPIGSDLESLQSVKGFENITAADLENRATFNLKDHMAKQTVTAVAQSNRINLQSMTREELLGLADAALTQASMTPEPENENA